MAHFKCAACHARVWRDGTAEPHRDDLCPRCRGPLEAVIRAEELIGLRAVPIRPDTFPSIAEHVREMIARNDAARRQRLRSAPLRPPPSDAR